MKRKGSRQKPHLRRSSTGKVYRAGKGHVKRHAKPMTKATPVDISQRERKQVFQEELNEITADLKKSGRAKIPGIGTMRLKHKRGIKKGTMVFNPFEGKKVPSKGRPARKVIKFNAVKALKEQVN